MQLKQYTIQAMTQRWRDGGSGLALDFDFSTSPLPPPKGTVLQRRRFQHALGSGRRTNGKRKCSFEEQQKSDPDSEEILLLINNDEVLSNGELVRTGWQRKAVAIDRTFGDCFGFYREENVYIVYLLDNHKSASSEEPTFYNDLVKVPRKYRMKDQFGDTVRNKYKTKLQKHVTRFNWNVMEGFESVTLKIQRLELGELTMNLRGSITFSLDYVEIPDKGVRITTSELVRCEWCTERRLPALFLQMTAAERRRLMGCLCMSTDSGKWYNCQSQKENDFVIIFDTVPTMLEKSTLEEIFSEIGRLNNISNCPAMLTYAEAKDRLTPSKWFHEKENFVLFVPNVVLDEPICKYFSTNIQHESSTLSILDSEDSDDSVVIGCPTSDIQSFRKLVVYPPPPAKGGFSITEDDIGCLDEGEFLNDVIVDFYLKYLVCEKLQKEDASRCHVFSSFFYKSLTMEDHLDTTGLLSIQERRHNRVKTWTRHLDLFEKDFIFVPINQSSHWYLAIICFPGQVSQCSATDAFDNEGYNPVPSFPNPMSLFYRQNASKLYSGLSIPRVDLNKGFCFTSDDDMDYKVQYDDLTSGKICSIATKEPCILIMDSLNCCSKPGVVKILQEYLEMEWWVKKGSWWSFVKDTMKGWSLQVPQQDNYTDCGVYLLQYVESFIMSPPQILHHDVDLSDWFPQKLVKEKREKIKWLIFQLHQQQLLSSGD